MKGGDIMGVLTISIQKGGTGKTATAAALAQAAAKKRKKVLAIDLDPQGNLSFSLGANVTSDGAAAFLDGADAATLIKNIGGIDIIPASPALAAIKSEKGSARRLSDALKGVKGLYDLVIIDTPPTAGALQYNALQAADGLIIPLGADVFSWHGLFDIDGTAEQIKKTNPALEVLGVVLTNYDARSTIARQMRERIEESARAMGYPFLGVVRSGIAVKEAATLQKSIFDYAPESKPAADYMAIYQRIKNKLHR